MSDEAMDEKRTDLKAALRELADDESGDLGHHPGLKRLIAYRQGTLPAAERDTVQEHLSLCPRCTGLLRELRDFEAAAAREDAGPESLRQEAWDSLVRRLPEKTPAVRPIARTAPREAPRRQHVSRFVYAAAAALLLAVVGLALWAMATHQDSRQRLMQLEQRLEEREAAITALQRSLAESERQLAAARGQNQDLEQERIDQRSGHEEELEARVAELTSALEELRRATPEPQGRGRPIVASRAIEISVTPRFAVRGQERPESSLLRAGGAVNPVRTPPQTDRFTVALSLADHPLYSEYRLELMNRDGELLWAGRRPGKALLGDAGTRVSASGLAPGLYRLRIEGLHPDRSELLAEYLLEVERQGTPQ
jgi:TolA-binding protein